MIDHPSPSLDQQANIEYCKLQLSSQSIKVWCMDSIISNYKMAKKKSDQIIIRLNTLKTSKLTQELVDTKNSIVWLWSSLHLIWLGSNHLWNTQPSSNILQNYLKKPNSDNLMSNMDKKR